MSATTHYKQNDRLPVYTATLLAGSGSSATAIDLTGCTVKFLMRDKAKTVKVNAAATVVSAEAGTVSYAWGADDLDTVGVYSIEWQITYPGSLTLTVPAAGYDKIRVVDDIA